MRTAISDGLAPVLYAAGAYVTDLVHIFQKKKKKAFVAFVSSRPNFEAWVRDQGENICNTSALSCRYWL